MATLQVRDVDDRLYAYLKSTARRHNRSISQEVLTIIENSLNSSGKQAGNSTMEFLDLTGAWMDERSAEEIIGDLRSSRSKSRRFSDTDGIFS